MLARQRRVVAAALVSVFAMASPLHAHMVMGTTTLRLFTLQSDFVARVRIIDPDATLILKEPMLRKFIVVAEVLEGVKGHATEKRLRFVQQGHGVARYDKGDEVVLFLRHIERSPELANSRVAKHVHWFSEQETGAEFALDDHTRDDFMEAVRAYVALRGLPRKDQIDALRRITVEMIASPHEVLAASGVRDLVLSANASIVSKDDLPVLEPVLDDRQTPIGVRIGLLAELERRDLVAGPPRWAALLRTTEGTERLAVVRAAAAHPSEAVARELLKLLASEDVQLVSTVAVSLGSLHNDIVVEPLAELLGSSESRLRMAAIRGLGRVGTAAAMQTLTEAAASHPDAATRRRAAAEVAALTKGRDSVRQLNDEKDE